MKNEKNTYILRITTYDPIESMDMNRINGRLSTLVEHGEIFNEKDFVNEVQYKSRLNEIDIDVLFQDILHMTEEEVNEYLNHGAMS